MTSTSGSEGPSQIAPSDRPEEDDDPPPLDAKPMFAHPRWMVGIVLILGAMFVVMGLSSPVWFLIGAPCIVVLVLWVYVRVWTATYRG